MAFAGWILAIGCVDGLVIAFRQIAEQEYLGQGLWRTALWTLSRATLMGALLAGVVGGLLLLSLLVWPSLLRLARRLLDLPQRPVPTPTFVVSALPFALFFVLCSGLAILLLPLNVPAQSPPYELFVVACFAGLWIVVSGVAAWTAPDWSRDSLSSDGFRLRWLALVGLALVTVVLRFRADPATGSTIRMAAAGIGVSAFVYSLLYRPARHMNEVAGGRLGSVLRGLTLPWLPLGILAVGVLVWLTGWATQMQVAADAGQRGLNVLIISVDTLRADRASLLSGDEQERDLTPNVRGMLAARGTVFTHAISQAPWTLPAFAAIFTGLYPEQHGADELTGRLDPARLTLAEILRDHGLDTGAVVSGELISSEVGMDQGFAAFDESHVADAYRSISSQQVSGSALRFLRDHAERPFFLFLHYFDPHTSYRDHPDFTFADKYIGWLRAEAEGANQGMLFNMKRHLLGPPELDFIRDLYDEEVAYTDVQIGRVLRFLDQAGLWESTLVIFVADHGEEFFEHGDFGHANSLYNTLVHVPLAIADPTAEATAVVRRPVETRWLFRTVLDFLGIEPPEDTPDMPPLAGEKSRSDREHLVRSSTHPAQDPAAQATGAGAHVWLSCLVGERWKLITDHNMGRSMLFDLDSDASETNDRFDDQPKVSSELQLTLEKCDAELRTASGGPPASAAGEEHLRRLRDLGYL